MFGRDNKIVNRPDAYAEHAGNPGFRHAVFIEAENLRLPAVQNMFFVFAAEPASEFSAVGLEPLQGFSGSFADKAAFNFRR